MIIVDTREVTKSKVVRHFSGDFTPKYLEFGDYLIMGKSQNWLFERKEIGDFLSACSDGRIWSQLRGLKNTENVNVALIIEGSWRDVLIMPGYRRRDPRRRKWPVKSVFGIIASILVDWNVPMIFTADAYSTAEFLKSVDSRLNKDGGEWIPRKITFHRPSHSEYHWAANVLMSIRGIGPKKAIRLLDRFKSIFAVITATESELIDTLGPKLGSQVYEFIHKEVSKDE